MILWWMIFYQSSQPLNFLFDVIIYFCRKTLLHYCLAYISLHYSDVIMGAMASQITSLTNVYSTVYSGADQRKHQSSASLAFVRAFHRWPMNSPHKGPVTRRMFPFDDVIMCKYLTSWAMKIAFHSRCVSSLVSEMKLIQGQSFNTYYPFSFQDVVKHYKYTRVRLLVGHDALWHLSATTAQVGRFTVSNRPISQIPKCIRQISLYEPICNRNMHKNDALWDIALVHFGICATGLSSTALPFSKLRSRRGVNHCLHEIHSIKWRYRFY